MRKVVLLLVAVLLAAPAMAVVEISATDNGDSTVTIGYNCTEGELPRGIALAIARTDGDAVAESAVVDPVYNTFIDWAYSNLEGYDVGMGHPFADPTAAGVATLPAADFSLCMGVLDQGGNQAAGPGSLANLVTITFSGTSGTFSLDVDNLRGGVVGSQLEVSILTPRFTVGGVACTCNGDANDSNNISVGDLSTIVSFLSPDYAGTTPPYTCDPTPAGYECYDANQDNKISVGDLSYIVSFLSPAYAGTTPPYTTPDGVCVPLP